MVTRRDCLNSCGIFSSVVSLLASHNEVQICLIQKQILVFFGNIDLICFQTTWLHTYRALHLEVKNGHIYIYHVSKTYHHN